MKLNVFKLVDTPADQKHLDKKWVFKAKEDTTGVVVKFQARWAYKGYMEGLGVDYELTHVWCNGQ